MNGEYVIRGRSFPMVSPDMMGDPMFVEAAARMEFEEFGTRMDEWKAQNEEAKAKGEKREMKSGDMRVIVGLIAVSVSRVERDWTPMKVARFVWDIDLQADIEFIPPEDPPEGDAVPLAQTEETPPSPISSNGSTISAVDSPAGVPV